MFVLDNTTENDPKLLLSDGSQAVNIVRVLRRFNHNCAETVPSTGEPCPRPRPLRQAENDEGGVRRASIGDDERHSRDIDRSATCEVIDRPLSVVIGDPASHCFLSDDDCDVEFAVSAFVPGSDVANPKFVVD